MKTEAGKYCLGISCTEAPSSTASQPYTHCVVETPWITQGPHQEASSRVAKMIYAHSTVNQR